jgi:hypothetical protein
MFVMRAFIGLAAVLIATPSVAASATGDQADAKELERLLARAEGCKIDAQDVFCNVVHAHDRAKAPPKAPTHEPAKAKVAVTQPTVPSKIPPLITQPFNPPWLPPRNPPWCVANTQGLFVRADPLDNFHYLVDPTQPSSSDASSSSAGSATGASINYTNNLMAGTQTATINGRVSYLLFGETPCDAPNTREPFIYGFGLAPFVSSNGTWNEPIKATSNSSLQTGADFQVAISTAWPLLDFNYFYASPYSVDSVRSTGIDA